MTDHVDATARVMAEFLIAATKIADLASDAGHRLTDTDPIQPLDVLLAFDRGDMIDTLMAGGHPDWSRRIAVHRDDLAEAVERNRALKEGDR